ncbi:MAG: hypothetical protein GEU28_08220 [Dehalococcoidia bacterium]|nr:hypothetical protein [Dehalococcoidia bacterium]
MRRGKDVTLTRPLAGLKVVDLTIWVQGPLAGQLLADLGADVIKVEKPGQGDFARGLMSLYGASLKSERGDGFLFDMVNRNKRSIAVDLNRAEGQDLVHRLVKDADVFVTNLQPETLKQFRMTPEDLSAANPRLIYALGAGLGRHGDLVHLPAQDTTATAFSGFMYTASAGEEPSYLPGALADVMAGTNLAFGVLAALRQRDATGEGQVVATSLLQGLIWLQQLALGTMANIGSGFRTFDSASATNPFMNIYRCADGEWIALGFANMSRESWLDLCAAIERPDLQDDERYARNSDRLGRAPELVQLMTRIFIEKPREEWIAIFREASLPFAPVRRLADVLADRAIREEGLLGSTDSGVVFAPPPFMLEGVTNPGADAPEFASDTFSVLTDLGMDAGEIARLQSDQVVW